MSYHGATRGRGHRFAPRYTAKEEIDRVKQACGCTLLCLPLLLVPAMAAEPSGRAAALPAESSLDRMDQSLTSTPGDPQRGKQLFAAREGGHCILCHTGPDAAAKGNLGPSLTGVGARLTEAQLRFRIVDITRLNPDAVMPAFHRTKNLQRVAKERVGQPLLTAQQVEDIVAYLGTLR